MNTPTPLDLGSLDPAIWQVMSDGRPRGPYTLGQMQALIADSRVDATTQVSRDGSAFAPAARFEQLSAYLPDEEIPQASEAQGSNFLIVARSTSGDSFGTRAAISRALNPLGKFAETLPGTFVLRAALRLTDVRRALSAVSDAETQFLILETRGGRLGWLGLDPGTDSHVRAIWKSETDAP